MDLFIEAEASIHLGLAVAERFLILLFGEPGKLLKTTCTSTGHRPQLM